MSVRSFTRIWIHIVWSTYNRDRTLIDRQLRKNISQYLYRYSEQKKIYMKINYVNPEHVHALIDLPTNITVEDVLHLYKGSSSNHINKIVDFKFLWGTGYGIFSVSDSKVDQVAQYIINQEEHHRKKSFSEEYQEFLLKHNQIIVNG